MRPETFAYSGNASPPLISAAGARFSPRSSVFGQRPRYLLSGTLCRPSSRHLRGWTRRDLAPQSEKDLPVRTRRHLFKPRKHGLSGDRGVKKLDDDLGLVNWFAYAGRRTALTCGERQFHFRRGIEGTGPGTPSPEVEIHQLVYECTVSAAAWLRKMLATSTHCSDAPTPDWSSNRRLAGGRRLAPRSSGPVQPGSPSSAATPTPSPTPDAQ